MLEHMQPDTWAYVEACICVLKVCIKMKALFEGKQAHAYLVRSPLSLNSFMWNTVINMYAKCGNIKAARRVFDSLDMPNLFICTTMITSYSQAGDGKEALKLFAQMQDRGIEPDSVTFVGVLSACTSISDLETGKRIHRDFIKSGCKLDVFVGSALVDLYAKCGDIKNARKVFNDLPIKNVVSWSAMITGYAQHGDGKEALNLFAKMQYENVTPDRVTFASVLSACAAEEALELGKLAHAEILRFGDKLDVFVGSSLVDMYAKCFSIENASEVFDRLYERNVVSWSALVAGYAHHGRTKEAFRLFEQMQSEYVRPNEVTFVNVLTSCTTTLDLETGKWVHAYIVIKGYEQDAFVGSTLVDMYAKCASTSTARKLFDKLAIKDVVSWSAMVAGYTQHGEGIEALRLIKQMDHEDVKPDRVIFLSVLGACAVIAALELGKKVHVRILGFGWHYDLFVGNTLVDMYSRCGCLGDARQVFNMLPEKNIVSWNVMISAYAQHGDGQQALHLFKQMQLENIKPNNVTLTSTLSACAHAFLVDEGCYCFCIVDQDLQHYSCMVDLLGRAGYIVEARDLIHAMPFEAEVDIWVALLGACKVHNDSRQAGLIAKEVLELDPTNAAAFVLLANVYAVAQGGRYCDDECTHALLG